MTPLWTIFSARKCASLDRDPLRILVWSARWTRWQAKAVSSARQRWPISHEGPKPIVPDVMLSLDVEGPTDLELKEDRTYFVWLVGKVPDMVIELVSNTEGDELGDKFDDYARIAVAHYVVYDPLHKLGSVVLHTYSLHKGIYVAATRP